MAEQTRALAVDGPFSLPLALRWLSGFPPLGLPPQVQGYRTAHVLNGRPLLVGLEVVADGALRLAVRGERVTKADLDAAEALVRRAFSLDRDAAPFYASVGAADPVIGALQQRFRGLRMVLFPTPFEALCWALLAIRTAMAGAARAKARLAALCCPPLVLDDTNYQPFPTPEQLAAADPAAVAACGIPRPKVPRLLALGARGATGAFEAEHLRALGFDAARAWLEESNGIGPWASTFVLIRGVGFQDALPRDEGRLFDAVRHYYGLDHTPGQAELERLAANWTGWRSWTAFLLRSAWQADAGAPPNPRARQP